MIATLIGSGLAIGGSILSITGALVNNLRHDHRKAMEIWMFSNIMLLLWACGYLAGYWNGALSMGAVALMYGAFTVSNAWGLTHV